MRLPRPARRGRRFHSEDTVMTHLSPDGGARSPPSGFLIRQALDAQIARRRARLAELEAGMIAACEAAAVGTRARTSSAFDRECWDRVTWHRYLAAAMRLEAQYGPPMRRLRREIGQLERLTTLPIAA
jgi:predicted transcriptional regulator